MTYSKAGLLVFLSLGLVWREVLLIYLCPHGEAEKFYYDRKTNLIKYFSLLLHLTYCVIEIHFADGNILQLLLGVNQWG